MEERPIRSELEAIFRQIKKYLEIRYNIARLDLIEKFVIVVTVLFTVLVFLLVFPMVFFFLSIALAYFLGDLWQSRALGFVAVAGLYFLVGLILMLFRNYLISRPLVRLLTRSIFSMEEKVKSAEATEL